MRLWRICRRKYANDPLSGRGGLLTGGRWHPGGTRVVYTSATLSLAALEYLVHTDKDLMPDDLVSVEINVPEDLQITDIDSKKLPPNWRDYPAPEALQQLGGEWVAQGTTALLRVPSAVIPDEDNYLVNPQQSESSRIRVTRKSRFTLDLRLTS